MAWKPVPLSIHLLVTYGVNRGTEFADVKFFQVTKCFTHDIMHALLARCPHERNPATDQKQYCLFKISSHTTMNREQEGRCKENGEVPLSCTAVIGMTVHRHVRNWLVVSNVIYKNRHENVYDENREGYWTASKFLKQVADAITIAEIKYPKLEGYRLYCVFDHSSCHVAYADDVLIYLPTW